MELDFEGKSISCMSWTVRQVKNQEQTMEVRLPDGMPEIGTVLGAWGQCILRGKEWRKGSIGVNGGVMAWALYLPVNGGTPQSIEAWIPFQEKWDLGETRQEGTIRTQCLLKALDVRKVSDKKLIIRAGLGLLAEAMEPREERMYTPNDIPEDVQLLKQSYPVMLPRETGERSFAVDEDIDLPDLGSLLYCRVTPRLTQQQVVGNKVSFMGAACCHLLYVTGEGQLRTQDVPLEFSQLADLDQSYDKDAEVSLRTELTSLEPEAQDGRIRIKCGLVAQYLVRDKMALELITDAYSPIRTVRVKEETLQIPAILDLTTRTLQPEVQLNIPCQRVVDTLVLEEHPTVRRAGEATEVELPGSAQVLYYDTEGQLQCGSGKWSTQWELPADSTVQVWSNATAVEEPKASCSGQQCTVTPQIGAEVLSLTRQGMPMLTGMELEEATEPDPARPSLILRHRGDKSLWELAKECGSTVEAICKANGLQEEPRDDRLLLIPV